MRKISIALTLTALLVLPVVAQAGPHQNPGNSAGDEYTENIPGAGGDHQGGSGSGSGGAGGSGSGGGSGSSSSLPPGTVQALQQQGGAGAGAANFANSTGPKAAKKAARAQASGKSGANGSNSTSGSESGSGSGGGSLGDVVKQVTGGSDSSDSDGMGAALPIILAASVLGALAFLLARRRGGGGSGTPGPA
jgi:hypothetical protein